MNIHPISESIKELLAEQNHDVTTITIRSMMNRIIALNSIVIQFVDEANKDEALSTVLGVSNTEVLQLHQFAEYIARLNDLDIGFYSNLNDCKLVNKERLLRTLYEMQETCAISATYNERAKEAEKRQIDVLTRLTNEINY